MNSSGEMKMWWLKFSLFGVQQVMPRRPLTCFLLGNENLVIISKTLNAIPHCLMCSTQSEPSSKYVIAPNILFYLSSLLFHGY